VNILGRYVFFELIKVFLVTLTTMTTLMILVGIVQEAVRESLTPETILKLIPFVLPNALCFAIPGTILFSVCLVYGRMSSANEIVAIKSAGLTPLKVLWPAFVLAFSLSFLTVFLNDMAVSWGRNGVYRVVLHSVEKTIYAVLNAERSYSKGSISINVDGVVNDQLIRPTVEIQNDDKVIRFQAETARIYVNPEKEELVFSVHNAVAEDPAHGAIIRLADDEIGVPLRDTTKKKVHSESPSNLPLRVMASETKREKQNLENRQRLMAMNAALGYASGDYFDLASVKQWGNRYERINESTNRINRLKTEPWRRWANGFSCLCFVLVGAPLAICLRRSDFWTTFGLCFIPILLAYYPLLMFGVTQSKSGRVPPPTVWLGNIVMLTVGFWLIKRMTRN